MRKTFQTNKAPGGVAPLSALTVGAGLVFLSGLTAMDPVTGTIEGDGVGAVPSEVWKTDRDLLLVYDSDETVKALQPDFEKLKAFPVGMSVYVTAKSTDPRFDIAARAFWPKINVNEDPVCGSMHSALMPFWGERLGKSEIVSRNYSRRGGTVWCEQAGDRVKISGKGALYLVGEILLDE